MKFHHDGERTLVILRPMGVGLWYDSCAYHFVDEYFRSSSIGGVDMDAKRLKVGKLVLRRCGVRAIIWPRFNHVERALARFA